MGENRFLELSWNQVWNRVHAWAMSYNKLIFKAGIDFSSPADSCHFFACWKCVDQYRGVLPHTLHMLKTVMKSSFTSHGIAASKNQFDIGIDLSQGTDSVESMPWVLKN
jgi:hypothetical protein